MPTHISSITKPINYSRCIIFSDPQTEAINLHFATINLRCEQCMRFNLIETEWKYCEKPFQVGQSGEGEEKSVSLINGHKLSINTMCTDERVGCSYLERLRSLSLQAIPFILTRHIFFRYRWIVIAITASYANKLLWINYRSFLAWMIFKFMQGEVWVWFWSRFDGR